MRTLESTREEGQVALVHNQGEPWGVISYCPTDSSLFKVRPPTQAADAVAGHVRSGCDRAAPSAAYVGARKN